MFIKNTKFKIFDSDALKNFHKRIFLSIIIFLFCYFVAIFRIAEVMIFDIDSNLDFKNIVNYERGKIYDRNGHLLSTNIKSFSLYANPLNIKNKNFLSKKLSLILNKDYDEINLKLNSEKKFVFLKRNISPQEHQKIIDLGEINIQTLIEKKRIYPYQNAISHLVGYVNIDNLGQAGIERSFEEQLSKDVDVHLTIDINLQNAIRQELINTISKFSADSGSSIVLNIKSGEILSLNNYPDFNPNEIKDVNQNNLLNRALQSNYEMASTFKPFTIAMAIDQNLINKKMLFDVSKPIKNRIHDFHPYNGKLSIKDIIVKSSNIGTAKIAEKVGKKIQIDFFKKLGFYNRVDIELDEAALPLGNQNNWGPLETMTIGYGYGFAITPLHLANAYSSMLNNGKKNKIKLILNKDKKKIYDLEKNQIIKKETSNYIKKLLRAVVVETDYTGPRVKVEGYYIGGKTGTAELLNKFGKYNKNANRTLFVGAFPMMDPEYLILTIIDNPKKIKKENYSITGATVNAPLVKEIILRMIEILNIPRKNREILNADITTDYELNSNVFN
jgi:cell division protein FtsI (penicillin-binding protein 3)